jgi:hypothetical protein
MISGAGTDRGSDHVCPGNRDLSSCGCLLCLERHPREIRLIMHLFDGLPLQYTRADLEAVCQSKELIILRPGLPPSILTNT